jgi:hypothetical protein
MTTPFPFTAGQVLTAAQMNAITELVINDKVASYTLVAGDAGEYVVMNSASATTITVNASVFTAGQVVYIVNKGTANTVITPGTATVTSSGSLTVPANGSGRLLALSASAFIYEAGGITASSGALTLITTGTFTTASSASCAANTFTSTYENYLILVNVTATTATLNVLLRWRASGTDTSSLNYFSQAVTHTSAGSVGSYDVSNGTSHRIGNLNPVGNYAGAYGLTVYGPQLPRATVHTGQSYDGGSAIVANFGGTINLTTQYDAFTLLTSTGTMTGTYRVYGYANS